MNFKKILLLLFPIMGVTLTACYGSPHADFKVSGKVMDENNQPINNIQVEVENEWNKVYTDAAGNYQAHGSLDIGGEYQTLRVAVTDIDGEENGGDFESAIIDLKYEREELKDKDKRNSWDYGTLTKEINFILKKKDSE